MFDAFEKQQSFDDSLHRIVAAVLLLDVTAHQNEGRVLMNILAKNVVRLHIEQTVPMSGHDRVHDGQQSKLKELVFHNHSVFS